MDAFAVTCLIGDLMWLMDIYESLKANDRRLMVHIPGRIWLDSPTLEQAFIDYERQMRLLATHKRRRIETKTV